jgi:hypothetical protein
MVATDLHTQARQPRGQSGKVRIRSGQMLAFLPIERLVNKQWQPRSHYQLGRCDQRP